MKCPNCGSEHSHYITNTTTQGPSFSKGCCGWIIFGPIGVLCSLCGTGSETEEYWICDSCGTKFQSGAYENELKNRSDRVTELKKEIESLDEALKDRPENLSDLLRGADFKRKEAEENYKNYNKEFINSSDILKRANTVRKILNGAALSLFLIGVFLGICVLSIGEIIGAIIFCGIGAALGIVVFNVSWNMFDRAKRQVDNNRAEELDTLRQISDKRSAEYNRLKKMQDNINKRAQKSRELNQAEQDLKDYKK